MALFPNSMMISFKMQSLVFSESRLRDKCIIITPVVSNPYSLPRILILADLVFPHNKKKSEEFSVSPLILFTVKIQEQLLLWKP